MFFFNNADNCACQIMNQTIETVSNIKFLGFHLEDKFKFNNNVKHLNKKISPLHCSKFLKPFQTLYASLKSRMFSGKVGKWEELQ